MKLVDADNLSSSIINKEDKDKNIKTLLDRNIKKILHSDRITAEQKAKLYYNELQRYLFFAKQNRKPKELKFLLEKGEEDKVDKNVEGYSSPINDSDSDISLNESEDFNIQNPVQSTPFKSNPVSSIHSSNPFLTPIQVSLKGDEHSNSDRIVENGHIETSPIKKVKNDTNPFQSKSKLERSAILTRKLVNNSKDAANKLHKWLSLSKNKK